MEEPLRWRGLLWRGARQKAAGRKARLKRTTQGADAARRPAPPPMPPPARLREAARRKVLLVALVRRQREEGASVSARVTAIWDLLRALGYGPASPLGPYRRGPSPTTSL